MTLQKVCVTLIVLVQVGIAVRDGTRPDKLDARGLVDGTRQENSAGQSLRASRRLMNKGAQFNTGGKVATQQNQGYGQTTTSGKFVQERKFAELMSSNQQTSITKSHSASYILDNRMATLKQLSNTGEFQFPTEAQKTELRKSVSAHNAQIFGAGRLTDSSDFSKKFEDWKKKSMDSKDPQTKLDVESTTEFLKASVKTLKEMSDLSTVQTSNFKIPSSLTMTKSASKIVKTHSMLETKMSFTSTYTSKSGKLPSKSKSTGSNSKESKQETKTHGFDAIQDIKKTSQFMSIGGSTPTMPTPKDLEDLDSICDMHMVEWVVNDVNRAKDNLAGTPDLEKRVTNLNKYGLIDILNVYELMEARDNYKAKTQSLKVSFDNHQKTLDTYKGLLEGYKTGPIPANGVWAMDIHGRAIISKLQKVFALKINPKPTEAPIKSNTKTYGFLTNFQLEEDVIENFGDLFEENQILVNDWSKLKSSGMAIVKDKNFDSQWKDFPQIFNKLKIELCLAAEDLFAQYLSTSSPAFKFETAMEQTSFANNEQREEYLKKVVDSLRSNCVAERFFSEFGYLLTTQDPKENSQGCGTKHGFQGVVYSILLSKKEMKDEDVAVRDSFLGNSVKFFSVQFFRFIESEEIDFVDFSKVFLFDTFIATPQEAKINIQELYRIGFWRAQGMWFHAEFFNDLAELKVKEKKGGSDVEVTYNLVSQNFARFFNNPDSVGFTEAETIQLHYFRMVCVLYQLYSALRWGTITGLLSTASNPKRGIDSSSNLREIYTAMYLYLAEKENDKLWFSRSYMLDVRAITMNYICSKLPGGTCSKASVEGVLYKLMQSPPNDPRPKPPKIIWEKVVIETTIRTYFETFEINQILEKFEIAFIKIIESEEKCKKSERNAFFPTSDGSQKITYYQFTKECVSARVIETKNLIIETIKKIKQEKLEYSRFVSTILAIFETRHGKSKDLVRYIIVTIISSWEKDKVEIKGLETEWNQVVLSLFHKLEDQLLTSNKLDIRKTHGLFQHLHNIFTDIDGTNGESHKGDIDRVILDLGIFKFDLLYLIHIAAAVTKPKEIENSVKEEMFTNLRKIRDDDLTRISGHIFTKETELFNLDLDLQKCRPIQATATFTNQAGKSESTEVAQSECEFFNNPYDTASNAYFPSGHIACTVTKRNDFSQCNYLLLSKVIRYLFTVDVILESVSLFDVFNHFSVFNNQEESVHPVLYDDQPHSTVNNKMFYSRTYIFLQNVRKYLGSGLDNIPNYLMLRNIDCIEDLESKIGTTTNLGQNSALKAADYCSFDLDTHGGFFWTFSHAFNALSGSTTYNLNSWGGEIPMGTTYFFINIGTSQKYYSTFSNMCPKDSDQDIPEICLMTELINAWLKVAEDFTQPDEGVNHANTILKLDDLLNDPTNAGRTKLIRRRLILIESLKVFSVMIDYKEPKKMKVLSTLLGSGTGPEKSIRRYWKVDDQTLFTTDDVNALARYMMFTHWQAKIPVVYSHLKFLVEKIYETQNIQLQKIKEKSKGINFLASFISTNDRVFEPGVALMSKFSQTMDQYTMLAQEIFRMNCLVEAATFKLDYDTLNEGLYAILEPFTQGKKSLRFETDFSYFYNIDTKNLKLGLKNYINLQTKTKLEEAMLNEKDTSSLKEEYEDKINQNTGASKIQAVTTRTDFSTVDFNDPTQISGLLFKSRVQKIVTEEETTLTISETIKVETVTKPMQQFSSESGLLREEDFEDEFAAELERLVEGRNLDELSPTGITEALKGEVQENIENFEDFENFEPVQIGWKRQRSRRSLQSVDDYLMPNSASPHKRVLAETENKASQMTGAKRALSQNGISKSLSKDDIDQALKKEPIDLSTHLSTSRSLARLSSQDVTRGNYESQLTDQPNGTPSPATYNAFARANRNKGLPAMNVGTIAGREKLIEYTAQQMQNAYMMQIIVGKKSIEDILGKKAQDKKNALLGLNTKDQLEKSKLSKNLKI